MKRGQNDKYDKPYFQPINNQLYNWWSGNCKATKLESKSIVRKAKIKRKKKINP